MKSYYFKTLVVFLLAVLITDTVKAQSLYVRLNTGYAFATGAHEMEDFTNVTYNSQGASEEQIKVSFGQGLNFGAIVGYKFNDNMGAELGVSMMKGSKFTSKIDDLEDDYTAETSLSGDMIKINPSFVLFSGMDGVNPYAKFGFAVGIGKIKGEYNENDDNDIINFKMEMDGGSAIGITAGLGVIIDINDKMSFFTELNTLNMSYAPTKGRLTEVTYNGQNLLDFMSTSEKEFEFVDKLSSSDDESDSKPGKQLKTYYPFSNIGINLGMQISF